MAGGVTSLCRQHNVAFPGGAQAPGADQLTRCKIQTLVWRQEIVGSGVSIRQKSAVHQIHGDKEGLEGCHVGRKG